MKKCNQCGSDATCKLTWGGKGRASEFLCAFHMHEVCERINPQLKAGTMWCVIEKVEEDLEPANA